jgi:hypothetical protein
MEMGWGDHYGGDLMNDGSLEVFGNMSIQELVNTDYVSNMGTIDSTLINHGVFDNHFDLNYFMAHHATIINYGELNNLVGYISIGDGFENHGTVNNYGTLAYKHDSSPVILGSDVVNNHIIVGGYDPGLLTITGNLSGSGEFQDHVTFAGDVHIGSIANPISGINAEYLLFGSDARLFVDIAGSNDFDRLWATDITLDGLLTISLLDLFKPQAGDIFKLF